MSVKRMAKKSSKVLAREPYKALPLEISVQDESGPWSEDGSAMVDAHTIMQMFTKEDWVFITADLLASNFALPWPRVMKETVVSGHATAKPAQNHPVQELLDDPTLYADAQSFWYLAGVYDCMLGNTIIWHMAANNKLVIIPAHEVDIEFNAKGEPAFYSWRQAGALGKTTRFPVSEIIHVKRPNPNSFFWGLSPFIPGNRSVLFNRYSGEFLNSFFEKGASPQMIIETEIANNKEAISTLSKSFELVNGGRKNQRRPLVLPKGAKAITVNMTLADTKLYDFINQNREVVLNILRVPKHAVGLQSAGSLGSEEHKTALRFMFASTVTPMLKRYATALTKHFQKIGLLKKDHYIEFDTTGIEIANDDMNSKADFGIKLAKTFTINEVRQIVWGEDPLEGGDFIPGVWNDPNLLAKKPPNDGGQQPDPAMSPAPVPSPESAPTVEGSQAMLPSNKWSKIADFVGGEDFESHMKSVDGELERTKESMESLATDTLLKQLELAIGVLRGTTEQKASIDYEEVALELNREFRKEMPVWEKEFFSILGVTVESGYTAQLGLIFDPVNREAVNALRTETENGRKAVLADRGIESYSMISKTTTKQIIEKIESGMTEGQTVTQITQGIIQNFKEVTYNRARVIARTETLTAVSIGQQSAIKNAAKIIPDAKKVWISANDKRTRDSHGDKDGLHGDVVGINEKFRTKSGVELSIPRDPKVKTHPEEIIQCRCTVAIVAPEDLHHVAV
jgi:HK97 family phage portal protein